MIGMAIIFHSGSYDRLNHGLSIALAASALGKPTKLFFSYYALEYLRKRKIKLPEDELMKKSVAKGNVQKVPELLSQLKKMGAKIYVCTSSMALLNIIRSEFVEEVDKTIGITTFLTETAEDKLLFI